jgi:23S rRNA C2498 (ribose-2'-O)-methylase RlmM
MNQVSQPSAILTCRKEFSETLADECRDRFADNPGITIPCPGLVSVQHHGVDSTGEMIFERQRLIKPDFISLDKLKPIANETVDELLGEIVSGKPLWTVHLVVIEDDEEAAEAETTLHHRLEGIWNTVLRLGKKRSPDIEKRFRPPHRLKSGGIVLQLLLVKEGIWHSRQPVEAMINPRPGGITRMKWDALAPSRSYLKMEEALEYMPHQPESGSRVIDLGAAPGGWTYSFIKRGCDVLAVDHGPMKLADHREGWGLVRHIRENGITFEPPTDWPYVDWLVADMLIAPGVALGLLRRWMDSGKANHIICNIKLPQEHPYEAIKPIETLMKRATNYSTRIKQLYHDRREVTVMAWKK